MKLTIPLSTQGDDSSTASFERTLSALSTKITDTQSRLDQQRTSARRAKVIWTLYLSFAYLVYAIFLLLVVGSRNLGAYEWTGMAGGPLVCAPVFSPFSFLSRESRALHRLSWANKPLCNSIYAARALNTTFYSLRIGSLEARLEEQQAERAKTIQKLKDMTKYDSTMELIEKYGGSEGTPQSGRKKVHDAHDAHDAGRGNKSAQNTPGRGTPSRTSLPPPPTANIQRRSPAPGEAGTPLAMPGRDSPLPPPSADPLDPSAEWAPNAFDPSRATAHLPARPDTHWYDRLFDVLLGEDETAAKNRIVLICRSCRLVNGLAPPGTRTLAGLGVWKCMACGAANGEADEGRKIVREVLGARRAHGDDDAPEGNEGLDAAASADREVVDVGPAAGLRSRPRKSINKTQDAA